MNQAEMFGSYDGPEWQRHAGTNGGSCGASFVHRTGWKVIHCGHRTANWPYYVEDPEGCAYVAKNARGFKTLEQAKAAALGKMPLLKVQKRGDP